MAGVESCEAVTALVHDGGMFRAFQVVLQPTAGQTIALQRLLDAQRELFNAALEERIGAWRWEHRTVSRFEQFGSLTGWDHPVLGFGVCPARGTLTRLDRAFQAFHRRCRDGDTPGFPRFKSKTRWDSVEYPDTSCWQITHTSGAVGRVTLKGVGGVRWRGSRRAIRGTPKTLTVRRCGRRWILTVFCADVEAVALEPSEDVVGVDVGVTWCDDLRRARTTMEVSTRTGPPPRPA